MFDLGKKHTVESILVITDIHNRIEVAQKIIDENRAKVDLIYLNGDYVHQFGDAPVDTYMSMKWLGEAMKDDKVLAGIGNHDAAHMHPEARCSGWSKSKHNYWLEATKQGLVNVKDLQPCFMLGNLLITHAGLYQGVELFKCIKAINDLIHYGQYDWQILDAHERDGGSLNPAGILWGRPQYNKLDDSGYFQVFGHTEFKEPYKGKGCLGIDTRMQHYAIITMNTDTRVSNVEAIAV